MKLSTALLMAAAASLNFVDARGSSNPLGDAMDALVNEERFFEGYELHRFMTQGNEDPEADAACMSEINTIYSDVKFVKTLYKINLTCRPKFEMTKDSFSMTNDYSDCDAAGKFDEACTAASGTPVAIPDVSVSCTLDTDEETYTSSYSMIAAGACLGTSCSQEYVGTFDKEKEEEMAAEMESNMNAMMEIFNATDILNMTGSVSCDVDIGSDTPISAIL